MEAYEQISSELGACEKASGTCGAVFGICLSDRCSECQSKEQELAIKDKVTSLQISQEAVEGAKAKIEQTRAATQLALAQAKSGNTMLYLGIGAGVLAFATIVYFIARK